MQGKEFKSLLDKGIAVLISRSLRQVIANTYEFKGQVIQQRPIP
jgi:hypothetical protein